MTDRYMTAWERSGDPRAKGLAEERQVQEEAERKRLAEDAHKYRLGQAEALLASLEARGLIVRTGEVRDGQPVYIAAEFAEEPR